MKKIFFYAALALLVSPLAFTQEPVGVFEDNVDVGEPGIPGFGEYISGEDLYLIDAVGATISNRAFADEFHFAYKTMTGSFAIEANPYPTDDQGRGGLMVRQSLAPDSIHISLLMSSSAASDGNSDLGSVFPTFRTLKGGGSVRDGDPDAAPGGFTDDNTGPIRLERLGASVHMYRKNSAGEWVWFQSEAAGFEEEVLAGLAATAENTNEIYYFEFNEVVIEELPLNVMRDVPTGELQKGATLTGITIAAKARELVPTASVREVLPMGVRASNVQASAGDATLNADGTIDWVLTDFNGEATLTYDAVLSQRSSAAWLGTFNDGVNRESFIGGDLLLPQAPAFTPPDSPIDIDPIFPTIIEAERGYWLRDESDFGLMLDLKTPGGVIVVAMSGNTQGMMEYPINIKESGTYYVFGRVRGEDGNSDSFHFNIDDYPAGDGTSYWSVNGSKNFANEWVSADSPREDPRSFQLDAGEHYIYLANREDSAKIDWFCVTSNRGMDIANFSDLTEYTIARSIDDTVLEAGKTHDVTIARAAGGSFDADMSVVDTPPEGWTVSNVNASAGEADANAQGQITWSLNGVSGSQTLTYTVAPPSGDVLGGAFSGVYTYNGEELPLLGDSIISQAIAFQNVNVGDPTPVQLVDGEAKIEAEDAYLYNSGDADSFSIRYDADAGNELYAYAELGAGSIVGDELDFVFEVTEPGIYRAIGRTRTPSGDDDSFFLGMDDDIGTDTSLYRYQGSLFMEIVGEEENRIYDEYFHIGWVEVDGDPDKSWDLSAGVHTLRLHVRENDTQVDWIVITNNLDRDPADLESPPTSIDNFMLY